MIQNHLNDSKIDFESLASGDSTLARQLLATSSASPFFARLCLKYPESISEFSQKQLWQSHYLPEEVEKRLEIIFTERDDIAKSLRLLRQLIWGWITFQHHHNIADFEACANAISDCAKQIIRHTHDHFLAKITEQQRLTSTPPAMMILGMGKLGGDELNFSSDIDLIFVHHSANAFMRDSGKEVPAQRFYTQLGQQIIQTLNDLTADGFVFRVDMRLRPFGDGSALVVSHTALAQYLKTQGREWERYAYTKADIITGETQAQKTLQQMIDAFVYRHYHDYKMLSSIRDMKQMIMQEMQAQKLAQHIKLGRGGIREIEFIAQCFQLIYGGQNIHLQTKHLKQALFALAHAQHIHQDQAQTLYQCYCFLRDVENSLQMVDDQQIHTLPSNESEQRSVVRLMGYGDWDSLAHEIQRVRAQVQSLFDELTHFGESQSAPITEITEQPSSPPQHDDLYATLNAFIHSKNLDDDTSKMLYAGVNSIQYYPNASEILDDFILLIRNILKRPNYLYLLIEEQAQISLMVQLMAQGKMIRQMMIESPFLLERALMKKRYDEVYISLETLRDKLTRRCQEIDVNDIEGYLEALRRFKIMQSFNILVAECRGYITIMEASDLFSHLATILCEEVLAGAWRAVVKDQDLRQQLQNQLAIIAYGKLGGLELSISSDLDLIFIYQSNESDENAKRTLLKVVQKFIHYMQINTYSGRLYEVDLRLRPEGNSGLLVTDIEAFEKYQKQQAWTWEHQALSRARWIAGGKRLGFIFDRIRHEVMATPRNIIELKQHIREMRDKMQATLLKTDRFDLKQSRGGMVDIEFMAQFFALAYSHRFPLISYYSDSIRIIESTESAGIIDLKTAQTLTQAYCFMREMTVRCFLDDQDNIVDHHLVKDHAGQVTHLWHQFIENNTQETI